VKVGDLVRISAGGENVLWCEPFMDSVGIITGTKYEDREWATEYFVSWAGVKMQADCTQRFIGRYYWSYKNLLGDSISRSYLKFAKRRAIQ
jgi:hypothetical protein